VLWTPRITAAYTMPRGYMNTAPAAQRGPAHLGSIPERHTATLRSTLLTNPSMMTTREVSANTVSAKMPGRLRNLSPLAGATSSLRRAVSRRHEAGVTISA